MAKLLVIEDEDLSRDVLVQALSENGHVVFEASDGETGLAATRNERPEIVICDMSLPKLTGWELVRTIREDASVSATPIIALSAHRTAEDRTTAYEAGVTAYEEKPADIARLLRKIAEILNN